MIKIWRSIVGKLWITILLLVSFVLFVFTVLMLEFLEDYHREQAEKSLSQTASTIASIVDNYDLEQLTDEIIEEMLTEDTNAFLASNERKVVSSFQTATNEEVIQNSIIKNKAFDKIYESDKPIIDEMILPSQTDEEKMETYVVLSYPLKVMMKFTGQFSSIKIQRHCMKHPRKRRKSFSFQLLLPLF